MLGRFLVLIDVAYCGRCLGVLWHEKGGRRQGHVGLRTQMAFAPRGSVSLALGFQMACD